MRRDTARRIALYHAQLPHLKEKLGVAALGLVIAALVSVSATFAWITLSRAPEVTAIDTTLSANGALEIALNRGETPEDADIDESAAFDEALTAANIRWGNLINLNDPSYGIADLTLRPAQLNTAALTTNPFWSAVYGQDGRITELDSRYIYTKYSKNDKIFVATDGNKDYGVRAISSYKAQTTGETASAYEVKYKAVMAAHTEVNQYYMNSVTSAENVGSLGDALGTYLQSKVNQKGYGYHKDPKLDPAELEMTPNQVQTLLNMFSELQTAMEKEKTALVALANLQQYIYAQQNSYTAPYQEELTWENIAAGAETYDIAGNEHKTGENVTSPGEAVALTNLKKFIRDAGDVDNDVAHLQKLVEKTKQGQKVYSNEINDQVLHICDGQDVILDGQTVDQALKDPVKTVLKMTGGTLPVVIGSGILRDFEQMAVDPAYRLPYGKDWSARRNRAPVHVEVYIKVGDAWVIDMTACLSTNASGGSHFMADYGKISPELEGGDRVAQDTYGMAVDFWLRSNAEKTYLTLEGAVVKDEETNTVLSFDGVNRVWNTTNDAILTTASTTQGGGSCYTYYADSPEELQRSLRLLGSMKVAFMNTQSGVLLATAVMDTENYYALNGRVTVPLVLSTVDSMTVPGDAPDTPETPETPDTPETPAAPGEGENGGETGSETQLRRAITVLYADREENLTAILYLDGANLTNQDVLSSGDIKGQLNLQFGSSEPLSTLGDSDLEMATRYVTAEVDPKAFEYKPDADMTAQVKIHVTGGQPEKMTGFFVREINAQQGTRQLPEMTFTQEKDGDKTIHWSASHKFTTPGTYYLHYVRMDGVDYRVAEPAKVVVSGFTVNSVTWGGMNNEKTYYTVDGSYQESVTAKVSFTDPTLRPQRLQAVFTHTDGNSVYAELHSDTTGETWTGSGSFTTSGTYTLRYLMVDGMAYDIGESTKTLHLYLGLSAKVSQGLDSPLTEDYDKDNPTKVYTRKLQVWIRDNAGNPLEDLKNATITYRPGTSASGAITAKLTPGSAGYYTAELPIVNPGRYVFDSIDTGGSGTIRTLTEEAPVFTIIPPAPPQYDESSVNSLNVAGVQYALLEQTAYITPIRIQNSGAVYLEAVVYNSVTQEYYTLSRDNGLDYAADNGGTWTLQLPTYETKNGQQRVDGVWQLVCLKLSNCYDGTDKVVLRDAANPIVWLGTTSEAESYKAKNGLTADKTFDFSPLSTEVISTVQVNMEPGTTALGGKTAAFMTQHKVADLGIAVTLRDYKGDIIPADKLTGATLHISYTAPDTDEYGYAVRKDANRTYDIPLQRGQDGRWTVDTAQTGGNGYIWQYVGAYKVTSLELTAPKAAGAPATKIFTPNAPDTAGIPEQYTVTSAAPSLDAVRIYNPHYSSTEFGKGYYSYYDFLKSFKPDAAVTVYMIEKDVNGQQYAIPEISVKLTMDYKDGKKAPNGGYSWTGTTGYEHYELTMTPNANDCYSVPEEVVLLAGEYELQCTVTVSGEKKVLDELHYTIQAYSKRPKMTVSNIRPNETVQVSRSNGIFTKDANAFSAANRFGSDYALVYMGYEPLGGNGRIQGKYKFGNNSFTTDEYCGEYARYTQPVITVSMGNMGGSFATTLILPGDCGSDSVTFAGDTGSKNFTIGQIVKGTDSSFKTSKQHKGCTITYPTERAVLFGTHEITEVTSVVNGITFRRLLEYPVTISQTATPPATTIGKLSFTVPEGMTATAVKTVGNGAVTSGAALAEYTNVTFTLNAKTGYCNPRMTKPGGVHNWNVISEGAEQAVYSFSMPAADVAPKLTVVAYPKLSFTASSEKAAVTAAVNGTAVSSGVGVKPGDTVTLTVTAQRASGWCRPTLTRPIGLTWTEEKPGDYTAVYTFAMPGKAVNLAAPGATQMHKISWTDETAKVLRLTVTCANGETPANGDYVIPGQKMTLVARAIAGTNPQVTIKGVTLSPNTTSESVTSRTYTFTMPSKDITVEGSRVPAPVRALTFANSTSTTAKIAAISVNGDKTDTLEMKNINMDVPVGSEVEITLQPAAKTTWNDGWHSPTMKAPASVTDLKKVSGSYQQSVYCFTMPNAEVSLENCVSAGDAPAIKGKRLDAGGYDFSVIYIMQGSYGSLKQDYWPRKALPKTEGEISELWATALPGTVVEVKVYLDDGYDPAPVNVTAENVTVITKETGSNYKIFQFTMGTEPVILNYSSTAIPTEATTVNCNNKEVQCAAVSKIVYYEKGKSEPTTEDFKPLEKDSAALAVSDGILSVEPAVGSQVTITVQAKAGYYEPRIKPGAIPGMTFSAPVVAKLEEDPKSYYGTAQYTFTMPDSKVDLTGVLTAKEAPTVTLNFKHENMFLKNNLTQMSYKPYIQEKGIKFLTKPRTVTCKPITETGGVFHIQPGAEVEILLTRSDPYQTSGGTYYHKLAGITVTPESADISNLKIDRFPGVDSDKHNNANKNQVTFTMGTQNITVTVPKQDP